MARTGGIALAVPPALSRKHAMNRPPMLSVDEARARLLADARPLTDIETVPTMEATGRVLAARQVSTINVPDHDNSSMDGYAVRSADCQSGSARLRVSQRIPAGSVPQPLEPGTAARIFTGAPIPPGCDAIVMQEMTTAEGDSVVINHRPAPGDWVRLAGEDIRTGQVVLEAGTRLRPQETGLLASVGLASVPVSRKVRVAVFFTGDELVMPGEPLPAGAIYNSSRFTLTSLLRELGCEVTDLGIVEDTLAATRAALRQAAGGHDLIMTSGGVSVGEEDHVKPAVEAEGRIDLWKIAMKPGKPLAFGAVRSGTGEVPFIGLPGNPVSSFVCVLLFVRAFVRRLQGASDTPPRAWPMRADFDWPKPDARQEYLRARLNAAGGLEIYPNQNSSVLTSTAWGDGLIDNPPRTAIRRGDTVAFLPFSELLC
jgi:molybdopterin molybdotransferase